MALAFLLLQTGFTKGSEDFQINHRRKFMKMLVVSTSTIRGSHVALATEQSQILNSKETVVSNTAVQHQTRDKPDGLSQLKCYRADMIPFSAASNAHVSYKSHVYILCRPNHWHEIKVWSLCSFCHRELTVPSRLTNARAKTKDCKSQFIIMAQCCDLMHVDRFHSLHSKLQSLATTTSNF